MIWIGYTTQYRTGGPQLQAAALTLADARRRDGHRVRCEAVESKRDVVTALERLSEPLSELHLISHAGMYGPMFGTTAMPEQFSPHEWRTLDIPFAPGGEAFFHACRSGRWFAPFFARTFAVPASGYHWYTTVSRSPDTYRWVRPGNTGPTFIVGQPGRKSHGVVGAVGKHVGLMPPVPMVRHLPETVPDGACADYDRVASLYDAVFADIRVRGPEFRWLDSRVTGGRVLDIGCGTGGLLRQWSDRCEERVGVDVSQAMLAHARARDADATFTQITGPTLPFPDGHFDVVTSMLSWRYVDWDPMLAEVARVLKPGGRLLVVDMVARAADLNDLPRVVAHKLRERRHIARFPQYRADRARLVEDPGWARMLRYNPIRAEHEYRWFFESRFVGQHVETLDVGRSTRVLAFDTGPVNTDWFPPQSYP